MANQTLDIYIPCRSLAVEITTSPRERLSQIESIAVRALAAGLHGFAELQDLLQFGHRPTLDLISDLWHRGVVYVDLAGSEIRLAENVRQYVEAGKLNELLGADLRQSRQMVIQELLAGHIIARPRRPHRIDQALVVPIVDSLTPLGVQHRQEISRVLEQELTQGLSQESPLRILSVSLSLMNLERGVRQATESSTLAALRVECAPHGDTDKLIFRIVHPLSLPPRVRRDMEERLQSLCEELPNHRFVKTIRERVQLEPLADFIDPRGDADRLLRLCTERAEESRIQAAGPLRKSTIEQWHETQEGLASRVQSVAEDLLLRRVTTRVLSTHQSHWEAIRQAIQAAQRQLIICAPTLHYEQVQRLQRELVAALQDKARDKLRVFLLWGSRPDRLLDSNVANLLDELRQRYPRFAFSKVPARINARMVLQDFERAMITSYNFLDTVFEESVLGIQLTSRPGVLPQLHCDLWTWCAEVLPEFQLSQQIERYPPDWAELPDAEAALADAPTLPTPVEAAGGQSYEMATLSLWRDQWQEYAHLLHRTVTNPETSCRRLVSSQHSEVFWSIIRQSSHRILLVADELSADVINGKLVGLLEGRLRDPALRIAVLYHRERDDAAARLRTLSVQYGERCLLIKSPRHLRSELVLGDETASLSSFRFLSFSGDFRGFQRWKTPVEVGVVLRGSAVVEDLLTTLAASWPQLAPLCGSSAVDVALEYVEPPLEPYRVPGLPILLSQLGANARDERAQALLLRDWFGAHPQESWETLKALERTRIPCLPLAVACCLYTSGKGGDTAAALHWRGWRLRHAWYEEEDAVLARLLSSGIPSIDRDPLLPTNYVLELAVYASETDRLHALLARAASGELSQQEAGCAGTAALQALLRHGRPEAADALRRCRSASPGEVVRLADRALEYFDTTGERLPIERLASSLDLIRLTKEQVGRQAAVLAALQDMNQVNKSFGLVGATWEYLYRAGGPMHRMQRLIQGKNAQAVRSWLQEYGAAPREVDALLDRFSAAAAAQQGHWLGATIIRYEPRSTWVRRLRRFLEAVEVWLEGQEQLGGSKGRHHQDELKFAAEIRKLAGPLAEITARAQEHKTWDAPLLRSLGRLLRPLSEVTV